MANEREFDASKTLKELAEEGWTAGELFAVYSVWQNASKQAAKYENSNLTKRISDILLEIGVPSHVRGYRYVRRAIELTVRDRKYIEAVTKGLYPDLAKEYGTTGSRVERAMRHAIECAWDRGDLEALKKYFGNTVSGNKGKPTNSEFIAMIAEHILLERGSDQ